MDARESLHWRELLVRTGETPPASLNGKSPRYSASTVKQQQRCPRKHFLEQACGIEVPVTAALADGTRLHGLVERWLKGERRPEDDASPLWPVVKTGLHHLPEPGTPGLLIEVPRKMATWPGGPEFTGTPDLMRVRPAGGDFVEVDLHDHKSTSGYASGVKKGWVLTSETLPDDVQNIAYSTFAFKQLNATAVESKWIYYEKKGGAATAVRVRMERIETLKKWRDKVLPIVGEMEEQHKDRPARLEDVEPRGLENGECESFRGCPHRSYCHKFIKGGIVVAPKGEEKVSENPLLARLAANAAGVAPKAATLEAPPPAPAVATPPLAFAVNPPPPPPAKVEAPQAAVVEAPQAASVEAPVQAAKRGRPRKDAAPAQAEPDVGAVVASQDADHKKLQGEGLKMPQGAGVASAGFNYYIGCKPTRGSQRDEVNVVDLLKPYCDNVTKVNQRYWQCVEYGQGPKQVAGLLESALESGALSLAGKNVVSPLVGPEAEICRTVLQPRAQAVVERFA